MYGIFYLVGKNDMKGVVTYTLKYLYAKASHASDIPLTSIGRSF